MSRIQKIFKAILPRKWFESMKQESMQWQMYCDCGYQISVWDAGGIRWKASGKPRKLGRCPKCGLKLLKITKQQQNPD